MHARGSHIFQTWRRKSAGSTVTDDEIPKPAKQRGAGGAGPLLLGDGILHFGAGLFFSPSADTEASD